VILYRAGTHAVFVLGGAVLAGAGAIAEIAEKVAKKFPGRKLEGILATTKIQVIRLP